MCGDKYQPVVKNTNDYQANIRVSDLQAALRCSRKQWERQKRKLPMSKRKEISRSLTKKIPKKERDAFLKEHNDILLKKYKSGLSKKEERRLTYINWQLDRFDDADCGEALDFLEKLVDERSQDYRGSRDLKQSQTPNLNLKHGEKRGLFKSRAHAALKNALSARSNTLKLLHLAGNALDIIRLFCAILVISAWFSLVFVSIWGEKAVSWIYARFTPVLGPFITT